MKSRCESASARRPAGDAALAVSPPMKRRAASVAVASALAMVTAALAARRFIGGEAANSASPAGRLAEALSHRDFIYLIVGLAVFGKAHWFLAVAAVGTPSFLLLFLLASRTRQTADRP